MEFDIWTDLQLYHYLQIKALGTKNGKSDTSKNFIFLKFLYDILQSANVSLVKISFVVNYRNKRAIHQLNVKRKRFPKKIHRLGAVKIQAKN